MLINRHGVCGGKTKDKAEKMITVSHLLSLRAQFIPPLHFFSISSPPFFKNSAIERTFPPFAEQAVSR